MTSVQLIMGVIPGWGLLLFPLAVISLRLAGTALGLMLTPVASSTQTLARDCHC